MEAALGHEADALSFFTALAQQPYRRDFYQTLRQIECLFPGKPRWGCALRPIDEPVRLGQEPELIFAPSPIASFTAGTADARPRLQVRLFGLLGPNGPLPIHITEYARERLLHAADPTLSRFLDLFHHRFLALFYRAWAQAQPHVSRDRPADDRFSIYIGAFAGIAPAAFRRRDRVPDIAKLFHATTLVRQVRNAEGLAAVLRHFFRVPIAIEEFAGHWMRLDSRERTRLGRAGAVLGGGAVVGGTVWDRQHKFRLRIGPLTIEQYEAFLPAARVRRAGSDPRQGDLLQKLVDWVRLYLCFELDWDVRLQLARRDVPALKLGAAGRLGWTTWLGRRTGENDADDLCLNAESFVDRDRMAA